MINPFHRYIVPQRSAAQRVHSPMRGDVAPAFFGAGDGDRFHRQASPSPSAFIAQLLADAKAELNPLDRQVVAQWQAIAADMNASAPEDAHRKMAGLMQFLEKDYFPREMHLTEPQIQRLKAGFSTARGLLRQADVSGAFRQLSEHMDTLPAFTRLIEAMTLMSTDASRLQSDIDQAIGLPERSSPSRLKPRDKELLALWQTLGEKLRQQPQRGLPGLFDAVIECLDVNYLSEEAPSVAMSHLEQAMNEAEEQLEIGDYGAAYATLREGLTHLPAINLHLWTPPSGSHTVLSA
jgi:hypothetical protein